MNVPRYNIHRQHCSQTVILRYVMVRVSVNVLLDKPLSDCRLTSLLDTSQITLMGAGQRACQKPWRPN